jgi:hypothetical protein
MDHFIREATETELQPNNMSKSWKPPIHTLKKQKETFLKDKTQPSKWLSLSS